VLCVYGEVLCDFYLLLCYKVTHKFLLSRLEKKAEDMLLDVLYRALPTTVHICMLVRVPTIWLSALAN